MIELIQFPWSPFCIVQRRILEFSGAHFKITNIPNGDRSLVWRLTKQRYYGVPIIRDGKSVIFEVSEDSQVIAKYLDSKLKLGLFPGEQPKFEFGIQVFGDDLRILADFENHRFSIPDYGHAVIALFGQAPDQRTIAIRDVGDFEVSAGELQDAALDNAERAPGKLNQFNHVVRL